MIPNAREVSARLWQFANCELDESRRELRVHGTSVELEPKPLEVLILLLHHAGEVVTKEELLECVWPGTTVVDGSVATAISKLRRVLGDEDQHTILTVPRIGYRLISSVQSKALTGGVWAEIGLHAGDNVSGRDQWRLSRQLEFSGSSEVWLAENPKTHELRVFKFANDGSQLKGLKREVTLSRFLRESLGERPDFVRVLEWNFDTPPFFLESEYAGESLPIWAERQDGLAKVPRQLRLRLLTDIAKTVAAAHGVGVLHKDLKPANVLITEADDAYHVRVADFGSGSLMEPGRLEQLGITNLGFTQTATPDGAPTGTLAYLAPEVLAGQSPTASADVYALGVILYQLLVADFRKPLTPGWEAEIGDPLLREDIAEAACGNVARRLKSAAELVRRLENLEIRRIEREKVRLSEERTRIAEKKLSESRARRPWVLVAVSTLALGLAVSFALYRQAARARDKATRQTEIAAAVNRFLANDLLGRSDPFKSGKADESLLDAVKQSSPGIDRQFPHEPLVAARLHHTIARALDLRTDYPDARREYDRAIALYAQSEGPLSQDAIIAQLQLAALEARSYEAGTLDTAKAVVAQQEANISKLFRPRDDLQVWLSNARGMIALIANDAKGANDNFRAASERAATVPGIDENSRLALKQRLAFSYIRLGDGAEAEQLFRDLIDAYSRASGADSAEVLRVRLNLAQALMVQNKNAEAVNEANQIYPSLVSKLGPDHEITLQLLSTRAQCEGSIERWEDAIRDGLEVHKLAVAKQGPASFFAIASLCDTALAQCRGGHAAEGERNARNGYEAAKKAFGEKAGLTGGAADSLAECLIDENKLDEAEPLLRNIDVKAVAQLAGVPDWGANINLAEAEISWRRGDLASAKKNLQPAIPVFSRADAEPYQRRKMNDLLARINARSQ
ncbi:MAG TPA: winged helix-turn-helix domain-containing protein [Candidatus Sulfotelmatobacter sp.]|nr:winged helix-turn-helix domain-containing protein [Candidatus Sulfotelmatobacter sp.]